MTDDVRTVTESQLADWGETMGRMFDPPFVIALSGELGAGKTTLTQAICRGYGVTDEVTSPTFALVHVYNAAKSPVHHIDLYRLKGPDDLQNIGWDDIVSGDSFVIVEWPERAGDDMPLAMQIELQFVPDHPDLRRVVIRKPEGAIP